MIIKKIFGKIKEFFSFVNYSKNDYARYKSEVKKFNSRYKRQRLLDNEI